MVVPRSLSNLLPVGLLLVSNAIAQEVQPQGRVPEKELRLADLPPPPPEFARLIRSANVSFVTGGSSTIDPRNVQNGIRIVGETRFNSRYHYNSNARWQVRGDSVDIRVRFRSIKLVQKHVIWLKHIPETNRFWKDRIVRHEFDHVKISDDARIETQFLAEVRKLSKFVVPASQVVTNGRVNNTKVQRVIRERVEEAFQRLSDYVEIRYRELDRITQHGLLPLPAPTEASEPEPDCY